MEEVKGEAAGKIQPPSVPPPCHRVGEKKLSSLEVGAAAILPPVSLGPGEGFPQWDDVQGGEWKFPLCW